MLRISPSKISPEDSNFIKEAGISNSALIPTLLNNFSRITLVSKNLDERLTLDLNLTFKWNGKEKVVKNIVVAELKQKKAMRNSPFYQLMKNRLIRPLRISKYTIGIIMLYGIDNIKYNRFKKKLLKLKKIQNNAA